jgi:2-desacetyl-2-hydroxyethyl bacteriochlorophyllide A dehydrogenase
MQGVVFLGDREIALRDFPEPEPGTGEVVVEIKASGMCGSDLHVYRAAAVPADGVSALCIAGHEPAGVVAAVGSGVSEDVAKIGDRVMVHHYAGCTKCDQCRSGWPQMCTDMDYRLYGTNENGAHAPFMRVPAATLVRLPDSLSFEAGAAIGCGTGTAWGGLERLGDVGGSTLVVFGQGPVGLSATMLATARGARVIAVDVAQERLQRAQHFGAVQIVNPAETDSVEAIREATRGRGAPLVLETSGSSQAATSALACLAPWGRACFVGLGGKVEFSVQSVLKTQMTIMTSWSLSIVDLSRCADFIAQNELPVDDLYSHRWRLEQAAEAYVEFDKQSAGKGVFVF